MFSMDKLLLSKSDQNYLIKCAKDMLFTYGLIIGQRAEPGTYIVVHLARNGEEEAPVIQNESIDSSQQVNLDTIDTNAIASQWISANKMIPGSFCVLGIFITSIQDDIVEEGTFNYAKRLLDELNNLLHLNHSVRATIKDVVEREYILLAYSTTAKRAVAKLYKNFGNTEGTFSLLECRIAEKPFQWYCFECNYDMDDNFPILDSSKNLNIEQQFQKSVEAVRLGLRASEILIQNASVEDEMKLDAFIKKRNSQLQKGQKSSLTVEQTYKANIFLPVKCQMSRGQPVKVREFHGAIRFVGAISSRIWCNPKTSMGDVKLFICEDIIRSLTARIQVYCDGLTDTNVTNDAIFISEPPRRVYFALISGNTDNPILFSEYLFRGEAPTVAVAGAKQILDVDIRPDDIIDDVEGMPDDDTFSEMSSGEVSPKETPGRRSSNELTRNLYTLGIAVSLLVLLVSVFLHLLMNREQ